MTKPNNRRRTGGPRTDKGKLIAAANSLKTGTFSRTVVLPGEDVAEFEGVQQHFFEDLRPQGIVEESLVREIAVVVWKKLRLERIEHAYFTEVMAKPLSFDELEPAGIFIDENIRWILADPTFFDKAPVSYFEEQVKFLTELIGREVTEQDVKFYREEGSMLYYRLEELFLKSGHPDPVNDKSLASFSGSVNGKPSENIVKYLAKETIAQYKNMINLYANREILEGGLRRAKTIRMLAMADIPSVTRATNHLDSRFHKLMAEFRKHRDWNSKNREIDVTPQRRKEE